MIRIGTMKATSSKQWAYTVAIPLGEKHQRVNYFIDNANDIPYHLRQALDCGEQVAGIFEFVEADQFAAYLQEDSLEITPK